jgi:hypothetical protein
LSFRHLILLTMAVIAIGPSGVRGQGALPGQAAPDGSLGQAQGSFPVNGAAPIDGLMMAPSPQAGGSRDQCSTDFQQLREEAERRGRLIRVASERHAPPDQACSLIANFAQAEIKMITFIEAHATQCGNLAQAAVQLRNGHRNTETMQTKICAMVQQRSPAGPVGDFDSPIIH